MTDVETGIESLRVFALLSRAISMFGGITTAVAHDGIGGERG